MKVCSVSCTVRLARSSPNCPSAAGRQANALQKKVHMVSWFHVDDSQDGSK